MLEPWKPFELMYVMLWWHGNLLGLCTQGSGGLGTSWACARKVSQASEATGHIDASLVSSSTYSDLCTPVFSEEALLRKVAELWQPLEVTSTRLWITYARLSKSRSHLDRYTWCVLHYFNK